MSGRDNIFYRIFNGIFRENPLYILCLGLCPAIAVTTTAKNGLTMGIFTAIVVVASNVAVSIFRNAISVKNRIIIFLSISSTIVIIGQLLLKSNFPGVYEALGIYVPLTAASGLVIGRAEAYAMKNGIFLSFFDGLGMGLGYILAMTIMGSLRELFGFGTFFSMRVIPDEFTFPFIAMAPGAFFLLAFIIAIYNRIRDNHKGRRRR